MYGLNINQNSGLRILSSDRAIYAPREAGYSDFRGYIDNDKVMENARTRLSVSIANRITPTAVAFESGCMFQITIGDTDNQIAQYLEIRHEQNSPQNFYCFSETSSIGNIPNDRYGIQVKNQNGVIIFHSSMKSMKILGHVSKLRGLQWYSTDRHIGKKYAFIQIGHDLGCEIYPPNSNSIQLHYKGTYVKQEGNNVVLSKNRLIRILKNQNIHQWSGWVDLNFYNTDVIWVIVDVTDISVSKL